MIMYVIIILYVASLITLIYVVLWLYGIDLIYLLTLIRCKDLRISRARFCTLVNNILLEEMKNLANMLNISIYSLPHPILIVDFRFEEVPGGRYIPPRYIFIQHTNNLEKLRETIRHELIHHIHWHCLRHVIPWNKREEFARKICRLLENKKL